MSRWYLRPVDARLVSAPVCCYCPRAVEAIPFSSATRGVDSLAPRSRSRRCWRGAARKNRRRRTPIVDKGKAAVRDVLRDLPWRRPERLRRRQRAVLADARASSRRPRTRFCGRPSRGGGRERRWPAYGRALGGPLAPEDVDALIAFLREGGPPPVDLPPDPGRGLREGREGRLRHPVHALPRHADRARHRRPPREPDLARNRVGRVPSPRRRQRAPADVDDRLDRHAPAQADRRRRRLSPVDGRLAGRARAAAPPSPGPAAPPRKGPIVINPTRRAPTFTLKENLYVPIDQVKAAMDLEAAAHHRRCPLARRMAEPAHHGRDLDAPLRSEVARRHPERRHLGSRVLRLPAPRVGRGRRGSAKTRLQAHRRDRRGHLRLAAEEVPGGRGARPAGAARAAAAADCRVAAAADSRATADRRPCPPGRRQALNDVSVCPSCRPARRGSSCGTSPSSQIRTGIVRIWKGWMCHGVEEVIHRGLDGGGARRAVR